MKGLGTALSTVVFCGLTTYSYAACDPAQFLKYEDIKTSQDIALQWNYLDYLSSSNSEKTDTSGGFQYGSASLSGQETKDVANSLQKQLKIDFSYDEKYWYTVSKLSETGKEAYLACLKDGKDNFQLSIVGDAMSSEEFIVDIQSTPRKDQARVQPIKVTALNGKVISSDKNITIAEQAEAQISRDLHKPITISVRISNEIHRIFLPAKPKDIAIQTRESEVADEDSYGGKSSKSRTLCVKIPNEEQDAVIIPNTLRLSKQVVEETMGRIIMTMPSENTREACALVVWHLESQQGRVKGTAYLSASVAKVVQP